MTPEEKIDAMFKVFDAYIKLGGWNFKSMPNGKVSKRRKLSFIQARAIRASKLSNVELAKIFSVNPSTVSLIKRKVLYVNER